MVEDKQIWSELLIYYLVHVVEQSFVSSTILELRDSTLALGLPFDKLAFIGGTFIPSVNAVSMHLVLLEVASILSTSQAPVKASIAVSFVILVVT